LPDEGIDLKLVELPLARQTMERICVNQPALLDCRAFRVISFVIV
jgi:hypothetical protein